MATILLPDTPGPVALEWRLLDFGSRLQPPLGGPLQKLNRLGSRFAMTVELPPMHNDDARVWVAALLQGVREGVRWRIRQAGVDIGLPGSPLVAGAAQAGSVLAVDGLTANYAVPDGIFLSVVTAGQRYAYLTAAPGDADNAGVADIDIVPPLRTPPVDNDIVEIGVPYIEGLLDDGGMGWTINAARHVGLSFTITEFA